MADRKSSVDIEKLIEMTVLKVSKEYQSKIDELESKLKDSNNMTTVEDKPTQEIKESEIIIMKPDKMIKIMHMAPGSASFVRGRVNIKFDKLFDERRIRWELLEEMYYDFKEWFDNFEIVILDKTVREYYGMENNYRENGADKEKFIKTLESSTNIIKQTIDKFSKMVSMSFLRFFLEEHRKNNTKCIENGKFSEIQSYYTNKFGIGDIQQIAMELDVN